MVKTKINKKSKKMGCDHDMNCCNSMKWGHGSYGTGCFAYMLGFIGAAIYYISISTGFWSGVLGFLKAIIWPLFLVLEVLKFLGA